MTKEEDKFEYSEMFPEEWTEEVAKETGLSFDDWCSYQVLRFARKAEADLKKNKKKCINF